MAIISNQSDDSHHTYLPTIALFCGIMCSIAMLKFGGFKATFNLMTGKKRDKSSDIPVLGAYRINREEYFGNANTNSTNRKLTASMVRLPQTNPSTQGIKPSKSSSDLLKPNELLQNSMTDSSNFPSSPSNKKHTKNIKLTDKEQKKLGKEKLSEQTKREKVNEQQKLKKVNNNRDSKNAATHAAKPKSEKKKPAPKPPANELSHTPVPFSSNTLESSISRSSGPPPYSAQVMPSECDSSGNTSFGKPVEPESSWDLVSQHRQQLNRPLVAASRKPKSTVLDLRYNADSARQPLQIIDNSEA